jgi:uncharacterized damage-inducible protein DinB
MRRIRRCAVAPCVLALVVAQAAPAAGQQQRQQQQPAGLAGDFARDLDQVRNKMMGLAREIPAEKWSWRPGPGVRSVSEVFRHVIADNYFMMVPLGVAAPAPTGITSDYQTAVAYENREMSRDEVLTTLESSFAHVKGALTAATDARLNESLDMFGTPATGRALWLFTLTHLHEHLGQMIAYARSNNVVPPWSRQGGE